MNLLILFLFYKQDKTSAKIEALLDTGALNENYISKKLVDSVKLRIVSSNKTLICTGFTNDCKIHDAAIIKLTTIYFNETKKSLIK
jgi:hypothetical protein